MNADPCDVLAHVANRIIISVRAKNTLAHPCGGVGGAAPGRGRRGLSGRAGGAGRGARPQCRRRNPGPRRRYRLPDAIVQMYTRCSVTRKLHRAQADTPGGHEPWVESIFRTLGRYGRSMEVHFSRHASRVRCGELVHLQPSSSLNPWFLFPSAARASA